MHTREFHADLETPVSCFFKLSAGRDHAFLFESVEGRENWATYSIIGCGARRVYRYRGGILHVHQGSEAYEIPHDNPLTALRTAMAEGRIPPPEGAPPFVGGAFGTMAYDIVRHFEPLPGVQGDPEVDDLYFVQPQLLAVFDIRRHTLTLYAHESSEIDEALRRLGGSLPLPSQAKGKAEPVAIDSSEMYKKNVERAKEHIRNGDIIQVVLSRRFEVPRIAHPIHVYRGLRKINPSPYMYCWLAPEVQVVGASPEVMVRIRDGQVTVRPIAGTRKRGNTPAEDARLETELLADPKERAEHIMLVDLGRNDVGRVSDPGTVKVENLMVVEHYSHVMHIVSQVTGTLRPNLDAFDAVQAAFPAGTLSGAPKVRAMQIIDTLEGRRRGIYGGAVGYIGPDGKDADFGIAIRTLAGIGDKYIVQAGAGIVADSDPQKEVEETEHKAQGVMRAIAWAASGESWVA